MNLKRTLIALALPMLATAAGHAYAANAEPLDLDANLMAKVAHQKIKSKVTQDNSSFGTSDQMNQSSQCGAVDIGNVNTPTRGGMPQRETTVIVTGDVINATKCR